MYVMIVNIYNTTFLSKYYSQNYQLAYFTSVYICVCIYLFIYIIAINVCYTLFRMLYAPLVYTDVEKTRFASMMNYQVNLNC